MNGGSNVGEEQMVWMKWMGWRDLGGRIEVIWRGSSWLVGYGVRGKNCIKDKIEVHSLGNLVDGSVIHLNKQQHEGEQVVDPLRPKYLCSIQIELPSGMVEIWIEGINLGFGSM